MIFVKTHSGALLNLDFVKSIYTDWKTLYEDDENLVMQCLVKCCTNEQTHTLGEFDTPKEAELALELFIYSLNRKDETVIDFPSREYVKARLRGEENGTGRHRL